MTSKGLPSPSTINPVAILRAPSITPISANSGGICMDRLKFSTLSTALLSVIGIKANEILLPGEKVIFLVVESKSTPFPVYNIFATKL